MPFDRSVRALAAALLAALAAGGLACASPAPEATAQPALRAGDSDPAAGFETPQPVPVAEVLPAELLTGPHHTVAETARSDGLQLVYEIHSEDGSFEARGEALLRKRIREIEALARLDAMSHRQEFLAALADTAKSPFVATWNLVRSPVDSALGVPRGAWEQVRRGAALARGERGELEEGALRAFIGFETRKRVLARELGVDPYSENPALQRRLNRFAWVAYAGGLPRALVPFEEAGETEGSPSLMTAPDERLFRYPPEDLRRLHRIELAAMGVPEPLADDFVGHPWYSPRHQTLVVDSLAALDPARDCASFFRVATTAGSAADALHYQQSAELLRAYHGSEQPIVRLVDLGGVPAGQARDGTVVVPLVADRALWTGALLRLAEAATEPAETGRPVPGATLLVTGSLSERARAEMEARDIEVVERAFERLSGETP